MAFKKGMSGNPGGRPAGAGDKKNDLLREWIKDVIENHRDKIADDLASVDPATRLNFLAKLLPYVLPRLQPVTETAGDIHQVIIEVVDAETGKSHNRNGQPEPEQGQQ